MIVDLCAFGMEFKRMGIQVQIFWFFLMQLRAAMMEDNDTRCEAFACCFSFLFVNFVNNIDISLARFLGICLLVWGFRAVNFS